MNINEISRNVIGCAIKVHKKLGPGLLESTYQKCLVYELQKRNLKVINEIKLPITYGEISIDYAYRIDILVEDKVVIELKSVQLITDVHKAQILTYLKLGKFKLGLLINFNVKKLINGVHRFIN